MFNGDPVGKMRWTDLAECFASEAELSQVAKGQFACSVRYHKLRDLRATVGISAFFTQIVMQAI